MSGFVSVDITDDEDELPVSHSNINTDRASGTGRGINQIGLESCDSVTDADQLLQNRCLSTCEKMARGAVRKGYRRPVIDSSTSSETEDNEEILDNSSDSNPENIIDESSISEADDKTELKCKADGPIDRLEKRYSDIFGSHKDSDLMCSTMIEKKIAEKKSHSIRSKSLISKKHEDDKNIVSNKNLGEDSNESEVISKLQNMSVADNNASLSIIPSDEEIIEVSSDDQKSFQSPRKTPVKKPHPALCKSRQMTLDSMIIKKTPVLQIPKQQSNNIPKDFTGNNSLEKIEVSPSELKLQQEKVLRLEQDILKGLNMLRTINLNALPDGGKLIKDRHRSIEDKLNTEKQNLAKMVVTKEDGLSKIQEIKALAWDDIQTGANAVLPKTFGKQAISTYNVQKALTLDRLQQLHGSLASCPKEDEFACDPEGLKVELMGHQRRALTWLMWREKQKPSGGILADDMGLGKTLTMISLVLKQKEIETSEDEENEAEDTGTNFKYNGGTLVVCPASLIQQWSGELERRSVRGLASYNLYHGPKRETRAKSLAEYDMVFTTYSIANNEADKKGVIYKIKWRRIILDEAHQIRNYKSQTSEAVCRLAAKSRWALTGTPVHNKELDMYALLKFLRCTPFDDLQVWKRWVGDKSTGGQERLHTVISSLMLRRTKAELIEKGCLNSLPSRKWELVPIQLDKNEMGVYQKVLIFSRTLFAQFLHQRAEKDQDAADYKFTQFPKNAPNEEYFKMREHLLKLNKVKDVSQHEILVLLLRLRQICNHPSLITSMLNEDTDDIDIEDVDEESNLLEQLNKLHINDVDEYNNQNSLAGIASENNDNVTLKDASKGFLNPSNPVFAKDRLSSKIEVLINVLKERVLKTDDKAIIVSQWASFLKLIATHLKKLSIEFDQLDGSVPVSKRMDMVNEFNKPRSRMKVLLLSLTAGGVGLNLIGANHLFLLDLHWNPQLENQAQDRIYRVGQKKPIFVYKLMATDTIEERIKSLQERKLDIANSLLTGSKQAIQSKLTMQDLKMLFDM